MIDQLQIVDGNPKIPMPVPDIEVNESAWLLYPIMKATEWKLLPHSGGLLDQPEGLMQQIINLMLHEQITKDDIASSNFAKGV